MTIKILYDNTKVSEELIRGWGFSVLIEFEGKKILFDVGADRMIFSHNSEKMGVAPQDIDMVFISHDHCDHIGGLTAILSETTHVPVYILEDFNVSLKEKIAAYKGEPVINHKAQEIDNKIYTTGSISGFYKGIALEEQSMIIDGENGTVLIVGCSHPGIEKIVRIARETIGKKISLLLGGFHLMDTSENGINSVIKELEESVERIGPTHCTGDQAIHMFADKYDQNFINCGVGNIIKV